MFLYFFCSLFFYSLFSILYSLFYILYYHLSFIFIYHLFFILYSLFFILYLYIYIREEKKKKERLKIKEVKKSFKKKRRLKIFKIAYFLAFFSVSVFFRNAIYYLLFHRSMRALFALKIAAFFAVVLTAFCHFLPFFVGATPLRS